MAWTQTRKLILPTAFTVTTFAVAAAVVVACGSDDDDSSKSSQAIGACADLPSDACKLCNDADGKAMCGPSKDCYIDVDKHCYPGGSS